MKLNYAIGSDRGLVRGNNEDSAYAGPHLLILADGMGGHAAGEVASQLMIEHVSKLDTDPGDDDMQTMLAAAAAKANQAIARGIKESPETDGMGTTLTTLLFNGSEFGVCHVGDSRGYRMRDGILDRITVDDTYVQSLVERGELDPEDVSTHPQRSMILKAYNGRAVEPTLSTLDAQPGDRVMLCSDGLSDPVTSTTIEATLSEGTPEEAVTRLIELALRSGGPDNVTVIVADVVDDDFDDNKLPPEPLIAGAPNGDIKDDPRPNTAAGRAAIAISKSSRESATKAPAEAAAAEEAAEDAADTDDEDPPAKKRKKQKKQKKQKKAKEAQDPAEPKKKRRGFIWIFVLIVLVTALGTVFVFTDRAMKDRYFITVNANDKIMINQGVNSDVLGSLWNTPYQEACLNANDNLTTIQVGAIESCHRFGLNDLKETARGSISSLPGGGYSDVLQQLHRLAAEALPVCVIRKSETPTSAPPPPPASSEAPQPENTPPGEEPPSSEPVPTPTQTSQQAVDDGNLNTPGVTCREVN
ncbi:MAG: protein phosphatase 2C domain-containing protein [Corynebacterium sp.]|nr:protein phosphatase 2C domain-containing protein [Corynebacterium sp.]